MPLLPSFLHYTNSVTRRANKALIIALNRVHDFLALLEICPESLIEWTARVSILSHFEQHLPGQK